ncbi:hypothetical protein MX609_00060 [Escherichia coli]|nr:hypothetical protein [Escherichia coli]MEB6774171.1 hypothetical protein [Escherichia coli]HCZ4532943.1 hypothetical protein [Escherichia coli]HDC1111299.1 hypothetical protein [Escherichia coli]
MVQLIDLARCVSF